MQRQCKPTTRRSTGVKCAVIAAMLGLLWPAASGVATAQDTVRITMPEAITMAANSNIELIRAENAIRSAETRVLTARGAFQPNLSLSTGPSVRYQLGSASQEIPGREVEHASGSYSVGLSSGYTLYNGNADRATLAQAEQLVRATDIGVERTWQDIVYSVITSFYTIATQRELIGVAAQNLEAERRQLERVRAFTEAETRPISDLYTQEATLAAAELNLLEARRALEVAKLGLVQTLRLDPLGRYEFPTPEPVTGVDSLTMVDEAGLVGRALNGRPEIAAQAARIEAAEEGLRIADASDAPTVGLSGSLGSNYATGNGRDAFGVQLFEQNPTASLGVSVSLPIFDRNRTEAAEQQAQIEYRNEMLTMAALRQQVAVEVRQSILDINTAIAQLDVAGRQRTAARLALEVEQARYDAGISTLAELSQARARYVTAEGQVVQARNTLELRRRGLMYVVGTVAAPRPTTGTER